jgi:hypothetical protein
VCRNLIGVNPSITSIPVLIRAMIRARSIRTSILLLTGLLGIGQEGIGVPPSYLPVLVLQANKSVTSRNRVPVHAMVLDYSRTSGTFGPVSYFGLAEASVRGNTSFHFDKKSYRLEFQTPQGEDNKVPLLGMPPDSDWVLYGSVTDASFMRTVLAHELWRQMGHYAVRWRLVEVFLVAPSRTNSEVRSAKSEGNLSVPIGKGANETVAVWPGLAATTRLSPEDLVRQLNQSFETDSGFVGPQEPLHPLARVLTNAYMGTYVLLEKIKRGKDRVNIRKLGPEDEREPRISGGYILSKDRRDSGNRGLMTGQEFEMEYVEPKEREITPAQKKWMSQYLDDFERVLYGQSFRDPARGYARYIDIASFVDFHWMVEMSRNGDGYWFSQYMHKDRGDKLEMGPVWDWDAAFGNTFFVRGDKTQGWRFDGAPDPDYTWYRRLFEDPDFLQRYIDRWAELRTNVFATSNLLATVDRIAVEVKEAQMRDAWRWRDCWLYKMRSKHKTFDAEVKHLKQWITDRLAWIDTQGYPAPSWHVTSEESKCLVMTAPDGRIFYTLDGSDPRLPGGGVSPRAIEYKAPLLVWAHLRLVARVRSEFGLWSATTRIMKDGL